MTTSSPRILLIDDCDADRYFFKRNLRKLDPEARLIEFAYADEALEYLKTPGRHLWTSSLSISTCPD
ncbi:hypothetical protein P5P81_08425 [Tritonibacter mobilis]|nr:hypothetical protein [Tritonibacter mobilis]